MKKRKSILKKISVVVNMSLIITAVVAVAAFYYLFFYMKNQVQNSNMQYLEMYAQIIEAKLEETGQKGFGIIIDDKLQSRLKEWRELTLYEPKTEAERMELLYRQLLIKQDIEQTLFNSMALTGQIRHLNIIAPDGTVFSSSGYAALQQQQRLEQIVEMSEKKKGAACWMADSESGYVIHSRSIRGLKAKMTDASLGTFLMWIDMGKIMKTADDSLPVNDSVLLIRDKNGQVIFASDTDFMEERILKAENGSRINVNGESWLTCIDQDGDWFDYTMLVSAGQIYKPVEKLILVLILVFLVIIMFVIMGTEKISRQMIEPIPRLAQAMKEVEEGRFRITDSSLLEETRQDEIGDLCRDFVLMTKKIDQLVQENYVKQLMIKETELRALQAQINPHFLYNVLESVNCMAVIAHQPDISTMVKSLGNLLRGAMGNREIFHSMKMELGLCEAYLSIQAIRFGQKLSYEIEKDENSMECQVPKFFLQPIVENAVVYGLEETGQPCQLKIRVKKDKDYLRAEVFDNGPGMDEETIKAIYDGSIKGRGNGIGLHNIMERLAILCEEKSTFDIISKPGEGTRILIEFAVKEDT